MSQLATSFKKIVAGVVFKAGMFSKINGSKNLPSKASVVRYSNSICRSAANSDYTLLMKTRFFSTDFQPFLYCKYSYFNLSQFNFILFQRRYFQFKRLVVSFSTEKTGMGTESLYESTSYPATSSLFKRKNEKQVTNRRNIPAIRIESINLFFCGVYLIDFIGY